MDPQRRLYIHHVVLIAALNNLVVFVTIIAESLPRFFGHSMKRKHFNPVRLLLILCENHPSLARSEIFRRVEATATETSKGSHVFSFVSCLDGVGAILYYH